jgi:type III pantothenate kinase
MNFHCFDIGNTRIKLGLFKQGQLDQVLYYSHSEVNDILNYCHQQVTQAVIISSTAVIPETLLIEMEKLVDKLIVLGADTPVPIWNNYATPTTLGKDRLAGVIGAYQSNPNENNLVIDAGTCITYDFIDQENIYQGGNISPGLRMRYAAMHQLTAKLPLVDPPEDYYLTSNNTTDAIQSGGLLGLITEIEGIIERFNKKFRKINVFMTGGDAIFLAKNIENEIFVVPNLVLEGLHAILEYNINHEE